MRIFVGFLVAAIALSLSAWLHNGLKADSRFSDTLQMDVKFRASWQDPLAILIAVSGVGAGIAIALPGFRR